MLEAHARCGSRITGLPLSFVARVATHESGPPSSLQILYRFIEGQLSHALHPQVEAAIRPGMEFDFTNTHLATVLNTQATSMVVRSAATMHVGGPLLLTIAGLGARQGTCGGSCDGDG